MHCPSCKTELKSTDKFCRKCGQSLLVCPYCKSTNILPSDKFCYSCGKNISAATKLPPVVLDAMKKKQQMRHRPSGRIDTKKLKKVLNCIDADKFTYESTIRRKSKLAYEIVKKYLNHLVALKEVCSELSQDGKRRYMIKDKPTFLVTEDSLTFLKRVVKCPYGYIEALQRFKDMTPSQWRDYCSTVLLQSEELTKKIKVKGKFVMENGKLCFIGGKENV